MIFALVLWQFNAPAQAIDVGDTAPDFTLDARLYRVADDDRGGTEWDPTEIGAIPPIHPTTSSSFQSSIFPRLPSFPKMVAHRARPGSSPTIVNH